MKLSYYKQQTPYTCGLACLRMVLEAVSKKYTEYELAAMINFSCKRGVSISMMAELCKLLGIKFYVNEKSDLEEISKFTSKGMYPIALVNPGKLYLTSVTEHLHTVVIKDLAKEKIIINDPDQEFGGENKVVEVEKFLVAWKSKKGSHWLLVIEGEK